MRKTHDRFNTERKKVVLESFGYVALIGLPNAGKSTLLNAILGMKLSIVSPKEQTTRRRVLGLFTEDKAQVAFCDTPGMFDGTSRLDTAMMKVVSQSIKDADVICVVVDLKKPVSSTDIMIKAAQKTQKPICIALNKIDKAPRDKLLKYAMYIKETFGIEDIFMISALKNDGIQEMLSFIYKNIPEGPWLYDAETLTDLSSQALATEFTREKLFSFLHQEIPYGLMVQHELWDERLCEIRIHQKIIIEKENHKGMVLGEGGSLIRKVRESAEKDLKELLGKRIKLFLRVVLKEDWKSKSQYYQEQGLEF